MRQGPLTPPLRDQIMRAHGVKNLVFSSSATVYGNPQYLPLDEAHPTGGCTNPYGKSKFFIEEMIRDLCRADKVRGPPPLQFLTQPWLHSDPWSPANTPSKNSGSCGDLPEVTALGGGGPDPQLLSGERD